MATEHENTTLQESVTAEDPSMAFQNAVSNARQGGTVYDTRPHERSVSDITPENAQAEANARVERSPNAGY